ncbi:putative signal transducing protein [Frigoriglobus tundricola]|uniref:DUF2007 domain-containing protein n=1 Tax=Frigoriglobus tundricola TaxID=2774151 RepID=A0A6M5YR95_9BACT|nr:DUF2007 domain-containing protein [Frigoriglobus tundricola]QJW96488.1 hypothetical protein FTUN_4045 [Frigoriglobus tundricola]
MAGKLVTIATFDQAAKARLAQNALEAAGIKAAVADETIVQMDWLLGDAVGWVKVQVMDEDADRAVAVLEEALGAEDEPVDQEALAAEAEGAGAEADVEPKPPLAPRPAAPVPSSTDAEVEPPLSERDQYARRLFLAAMFGLVIPLLWFYAVYLFLNAAFGPGPLSARGRNKLLLGGFLLIIGSFMALYLIRLYGDPFG